jgi:protein pelota
MRLVFQDSKHGEIKVIPETLDDLWHLSNIIDVGDLVRAVTFRTDEQKDDKIRSKKATKKRMKLGVRVSEVRFHEFSDRLRIHGTIEEGPQDLGSFHTFNITADANDSLSIVKEEWKPHQLERIKEAVQHRNDERVVFISLDEDMATIAVLRHSGIQWIADIPSHRSGKMYKSEDTSTQYFGDILSVVKTVINEQVPLVIVGPGFTKDHLVTYGRTKTPDLFNSSIVYATGNAGMNGIQEAIKTGIIRQVAKENRVMVETQLVEKLLQEIQKDGLAAYGIKEVGYAIQNGAVDHLLITDTMVRTSQGDELLMSARNAKSQFTIINTQHDAGKTLDGLGGIGALLRFKLQL